MALWKETPSTGTSGVPAAPTPISSERTLDRPANETMLAGPSRRIRERTDGVDSVIAANLNIEGKIEGAGNVRMAGRFKGDVRIDGDFNIEAGAHLTGQVLAGVVVVGGELQGNIESAKRVDLLDGGIIVGDVKAGSITVAAGSRMRGHVEFGWEDEKGAKISQGFVGAGTLK
jgi:cytoskeletal protein CcmA (bactofilin family)